MEHKEIVKKWHSKRVQESASLGYQCVAWAKKYVAERYGLNLGVFGGSANSGWKNVRKTFDPKKWRKVEYSPGKIPPTGSVIFWKSNTYGHVAIVGEGSTVDTLVIIEQNLKGSARGVGQDAISERNIAYRDTFRGKLTGWYEWIAENKGKYETILAEELKKHPDYTPIFSEYSGDAPLSEKEIKVLIEIACLRMREGISNSIDK